MIDADDTPTPPRYVVIGGGTPTPEQLAALAVAMTPVAVPDESEQAPASGAPSNWAHAALMEGVGHRTFVAMPDLAGGRFPLA